MPGRDAPRGHPAWPLHLVQTLTAVVLGSIGIMVTPFRVSAGPEANQLTAAWFTAWVA